MCTQDHILYSCLHALKGEKHPCARKQSSPHAPCWSNTRRELSLKQRCPDCHKSFLAAKNVSHWPYVEHLFLGKPLPAKLLWGQEKEEENWGNEDEGTKAVDFVLFEFGGLCGGRDKEVFVEERMGKRGQGKGGIAFCNDAFETNDASTRAKNGYPEEKTPVPGPGLGLGLGLGLGIGVSLGFPGGGNPKQIPTQNLGKLEQVPILFPPPSSQPRLARPIIKRRSSRQHLELTRTEKAGKEESLGHEKATSYEKIFRKQPSNYNIEVKESGEDRASTPKPRQVRLAETTPRARVHRCLSTGGIFRDGGSKYSTERHRPIQEDVFGSAEDDVSASPKIPRSRTPRHFGSNDELRVGGSKFSEEKLRPTPEDMLGSHVNDILSSPKFIRKRDPRHLGPEGRVWNGGSNYMTERRQPITTDLFSLPLQDTHPGSLQSTEWELDPFRYMSKRSRARHEQKARIQEFFDLNSDENTEDDLIKCDRSFGTGRMDLVIR
ncbi:hypothetical protein BGZ60DRAFT_548339 [Tricladium varicosporioides]|nr:hypothetical protein BGZ60DRAFT_548339 [Hymenoscyphus varicosporioides]